MCEQTVIVGNGDIYQYFANIYDKKPFKTTKCQTVPKSHQMQKEQFINDFSKYQ